MQCDIEEHRKMMEKREASEAPLEMHDFCTPDGWGQGEGQALHSFSNSSEATCVNVASSKDKPSSGPIG